MPHCPPHALIALLLAGGASLLAAPATAQVGGILDLNFIVPSEAGLSGLNPTGSDIYYMRRAVDALAQGDFKRSLAILRPYRLGASSKDLLLAGLAHSGLGDYAAARKNLERALQKRRNFIPAQVALGVLEARHGDRASAVKLLQALTSRRDACVGICSQQAELTSGVDRIHAALQARALPET